MMTDTQTASPRGGRLRCAAQIIAKWRDVKPVEVATLEWVDLFNNRRLLEPSANIPPVEAEANYYAVVEKRKRCPGHTLAA